MIYDENEKYIYEKTKGYQKGQLNQRIYNKAHHKIRRKKDKVIVWEQIGGRIKIDQAKEIKEKYNLIVSY